jgi:hypothetical protein
MTYHRTRADIQADLDRIDHGRTLGASGAALRLVEDVRAALADGLVPEDPSEGNWYETIGVRDGDAVIISSGPDAVTRASEFRDRRREAREHPEPPPCLTPGATYFRRLWAWWARRDDCTLPTVDGSSRADRVAWHGLSHHGEWPS